MIAAKRVGPVESPKDRVSKIWAVGLAITITGVLEAAWSIDLFLKPEIPRFWAF